MLNKLFRKNKSIYLAGWEVDFNGDSQCDNFIAAQITNKKTIENIYKGVELIFENSKLIKAIEYTEGIKKERILNSDEIGLPIPNHPPNKIFQLVEKNNGKHQLGGELPSDFIIPENNCVVPFQYIGYINNNDPNFSWLPFKLHLTCPIYLNIENVFLDYTNSSNPVIINREEVEEADTSYEDDLNKESEIIFEEMKFDFIESFSFSSIGNAGIPNWIQYPSIPICPKSGKRMKFLCQLNGGVNTKRSNVTPENEWYNQYYEKMNFWGDGDLFIFFEPTSKTACYFIQNT